MVVRPDTLFFFAASGFILGAVLGGLGASPLVALLLAAFSTLAALSFLPFERARQRAFATMLALAGFFLVGNVYYAVNDYAYRSALQGVERVTRFEGVVREYPRRSLTAQTVKVELMRADVESAASGSVYVRADLYPELSYGDVVRVFGEIVPPPPDSYGRYMKKEGMHGTVFYPEIEIIGNEGNALQGALFSLRGSIKETLGRLFTHQHAAFLSGILLGDKDEFSPEFLQKLSVSGTMHLMALSGLNMTIIVFVTLAVFSVVFRGRVRARFIATFSVVALFTAMTGFQVSAIRAALMAFIVGLAGVTHRTYNPRNAIAFAALIIALWNPTAPVYDLGFQLSFLATLAIMYLAPVLKRLPPLSAQGTLGWRDAVAITLAAELGVAPLTIINFGTFSLTALFANVGILAVIPLLTVLGFLVVLFELLFPPLAFLLATLTAFLIDYVVAVVETFAALYVPFNPHIGAATAAVYYCVVIWICWRFAPARKAHEKSS